MNKAFYLTLLALLASLALGAPLAAGQNNAPTGRVVIQLNDENAAHGSASFTTTPVTLMATGTVYSIGVSTGGGNLRDADSTVTITRSRGGGQDSVPSATELVDAASGARAAFAGSGEGISWQYSTSASGPWTEHVFGSDADGSSAANYSISTTVKSAGWVRVCLFYTDPANNAEGGDSTSAATRAMATSDNTCSVAITTNSPPVPGAITAADNTDLTTTGPNEGNALTAANPTDPDGTTTATTNADFAWQWSQASANGGTYTAINGATAATFTPLQAQVGQFLRACATFTDDSNTQATACTSLAHAVVDVNNAPTGTPAWTNSANEVVTALTEDESYSVTATSNGGNDTTGRVMDADGLPDPDPALSGGLASDHFIATYSFQRKVTSTNPATWHEVQYATPATASTTASYTLGDADVDAGAMRVCMFYTDKQGAAEGGTATDAMTRASTATLCSAEAQVANVNDLPTGSIAVNTGGSVFTAAATGLAVGTLYAPGPTTGGGTLMDADGYLTEHSSGRFSWQRSADVGSTWTEIKSAGYGTDISYTPVAADATAGHIRVCHFYTDGDGTSSGTVEGFAPGVSITAPTSGSNEGTAAQRLAGTICTAALPVITNKPAILGNITAADMTVLATTGPNEDNALTAPNPTDADGVTSATFTWQWSQADTHGGTYTNISGATAASFTPVDAQVNSFLRVCVSFEDDEENAEQVCASLPHAVVNINDAPTHPANGGDLSSTPNRFVEDMPATIMTDGIMDEDGLEGVVFEVRWYAGTGAELQTFLIGGKSAVFPRDPVHIGPTFTPLQEHTSGPITTQTPSAILVCVFFTDNHGTAERYCKTLHNTRNTDDVPTGQITIGNSDGAAVHRLTQGVQHYVGFTTAGGTFADEDGVTIGNNMLASPGGISWQTAPTPLGPWAEQSFGRNDSESNFGYTIDQDDVNAGWIRACLFYTDSSNFFNGAGGKSSNDADNATERQRNASYCTRSHPLVNANDAPSASAGSVTAPVGGSYAFRAEDFPFTDADGDSLSAVVVATLPASGKGTLSNGSTAITAGDAVPVADIRAGRFTYAPPSTQTAASTGFASFTFNVTDDGSDGSGDRTSTTAATMTVDLVAAAASAATGDPTITIPTPGGSFTDKEPLRADISAITDANGIRTSTIRYEWSQAMPTPAGTAPAMTSGSWRTISRSASTDFTPDQAQVGDFIRLCVTFEDYTGNPEMRCTVSTTVLGDDNFPPAALPGIISVPLNADADNPYVFTLDDFDFRNEARGDPLQSIFMVSNSLQTATTRGVVRVAGTVLSSSQAHTITVAQIAAGQMTYYPLDPPATPTVRGLIGFSPRVAGISGLSNNLVIYLVMPEDGPATGTPTLDATEAMVGQQIEANDNEIVANSGVEDDSFIWQWQESDDGASGWRTVASRGYNQHATTHVNFTRYIPTPAQAGKHIRACASFDNSLGQAEGPLCSAPVMVASLPIVTAQFVDGASGPESNVSHAITASLDVASSADTYLTFTIESGEGSWSNGIRNITIPAGQTSTSFSLTLVTVDNIIAQNDRDTVISVAAANAMGVVPPDDLVYTIVENDRLAMNLQVAASGDEGGVLQSCVTFGTPFVGQIAVNPTLAIDPDLAGNTATLADASLVADTVVGMPGDTQVCYGINLHNNHRRDGPRGFITTFAAASVNDAVKTLWVQDNSATFQIADDEVQGRPAWQDTASTGTTLNTLTEGGTYNLATNAVGGNLMDASEAGTIPTANDNIARSYQAAPAANGPWAEFTATETDSNYIPLQRHVGQYIRACAFFRDSATGTTGNWEGGPPDAMGAAYASLSKAQREAGTLCTIGLQVANVNSPPVIAAGTVLVPTDAAQADPYTFKEADFPFSDEDGDDILTVTISPLAVNGTGTLRVGSTAVTADTVVNRANIGTITYYPPTGQSATEGYASFSFSITDDGSDPDTSTNTAAAAPTTLSINLVAANQTAASGSPTVGTALAAPDQLHREDVGLLATTVGITEPNGIDRNTIVWQWQSAPAPASGTPAAGDWTAIAEADSSTFTPTQDHVGLYIRACVRFMDGIGNAEGPLCSGGGQITNVNDAPEGAPTIMAADGTDLTEVGPNEGAMLTASISGITDPDGLTSPDPSWQWHQDSGGNGTFATIDTGGTFATFTPGNDHVGNALRACATIMDDGGASEELCADTMPVVGVNSPASGAPVLIYSSSPSVSNLGGTAGSPVTSVPEGIRLGIFRVIKTSEGGVVDADGFPAGQQMFFSYQAGSAAGGWSEFGYDDITRNLPSFFDDSHVALGFMRICMFYTDNGGEVEGGPRTTPAERASGTICSTPVPITEVSSKPVAEDAHIAVPATASSSSPYTFRAADFRSTDPDAVDDTVLSVQIASLPEDSSGTAAGTLQVGGSDATVGQSVNIADIGTITYWPASGQSATAGYASFTFQVTDDGGTPSPLAASTTLVADAIGTQSAAATITIDLTSATQTAATGRPRVDAVDDAMMPYYEDVQLMAMLGTVADVNGIDLGTLVWSWQLGPGGDGDLAPADSDFTTTATGRLFTPLNEHGGQSLRLCASFMDAHATPVAEGPLCTLPRTVVAVNDAPAAADGLVEVFSTASRAEPFTFTPEHFGYADEEGAPLAAITLVAAPALGTVRGGLLPLASGDSSAAISWYPPANAEPADGYTTFSFRLSDGALSSQTRTMTINLVPPGPVAATGAPTLSDAAATWPEDSERSASISGIRDPNGIDEGTVAWQWQAASPAQPNMAPADDSADWADLAGQTAAAFTPLQANVGQWLRACVRFRDLGTDPISGAADPADEGPLCSSAARVINVNDAPTSGDFSVDVFTVNSADEPFFFSRELFPFADEDPDGENNSLARVTIVAAPALGTLRYRTGDDGQVLAAGNMLLADSLADLNYYPPQGAEAADAYASITFTVSDGAASSQAHSITINLVPPVQTPATGNPTVAASTPGQSAFDEDVQLTASITGVRDINGIDTDSLQWQWQHSPTAAGNYAPIAGADEAAFTPLQEHVGGYVRACVSFMDEHENAETGEADPGSEGPLCSIPSLAITNVNDAPTSADSQINVFTIADADNPYHLTAADFPFADEDVGDNSTLSSIRVVDTISAGNLLLGVNDVRDGTLITAAELAELRFWPDADTEATPAYTTFSFRLSDGLAETAEHIMTINIVPPGQLDASGEPAITGTPEQNATLTAGRGTVRDPNGIDDDSIAWQWSMAATTSGTFTAIPGASGPDADEFIPTQTQVDRYLQLCMTFMDEFVDLATNSPQPGQESRCSAPFGPIANVNDAPQATDHHHQAARTAGSDAVQLPASVFIAAWSDPDPEDRPQSITITALPDESHGTLTQGNAEVAAGQPLALADGAFSAGPLTFTIAEGVQDSSLRFTISDGTLSSNQATLTLSFGRDIEQKQVQQVSAILSAAAITNATGAISAALSAAPAAPAATPAFDLSAAGTSLTALGRSLQRNLGPADPADPADPAATARAAITQDNTALPPTMATAAQRAWYLGTTGHWQQLAAANAADHSADAILARISALANGDLALQYSMADLADMRIWARFQSLEFSGNPLQRDGTDLVYDGSGTGFYLGADTRITDGIRAGLAIGTDSSDLSLDLDNDDNDDAASRSATSFYPYLHINLGSGNQARIIAGTGSGDLTIKSSANNNQSATTDLSWSMLAASASHDRPIEGPIHLRASASLQTGSSSTDAATFAAGSTLMAGDSSSSELAFATEFSYHRPGIVPHATLTARKWFGDLKQGMAYDLGLGADINTGPATLRLAMTRQINATTHKRHSISINAATTPNALGITASLGASHDSTGKPQWNSRIGWRQGRTELSLDASPAQYRLRARWRW